MPHWQKWSFQPHCHICEHKLWRNYILQERNCHYVSHYCAILCIVYNVLIIHPPTPQKKEDMFTFFIIYMYAYVYESVVLSTRYFPSLMVLMKYYLGSCHYDGQKLVMVVVGGRWKRGWPFYHCALQHTTILHCNAHLQPLHCETSQGLHEVQHWCQQMCNTLTLQHVNTTPK